MRVCVCHQRPTDSHKHDTHAIVYARAIVDDIFDFEVGRMLVVCRVFVGFSLRA